MSTRLHLRPRSLHLAVVMSLALHLLLGWGVGQSWYEGRLAAAALEPPRPDPVRFELVDTPESAATETPPADSRFLSNRNTRSQDRADDKEPANRRPRLTGDGDTHDLRPANTSPRLAPPSPVAASAPSPSASSAPAPPSPEATETARRAVAEVALEAEPSAARPVPRPVPPTPAVPAARPVPSVEPAPDPGAFVRGPTVQPGRPSLSEVEKDLLARAEAEGELSFEATQHFFADYFFKLRDKVENAWLVLLMGRYSSLERSTALVEFKVLPDGSVREIALGPAEGDELFPLVCSLAVRNAAPFAPVPYDSLPRLPPEVRELPLRVRVHFNYR